MTRHVEVLIPCFNAGLHIARTVENVFDQTYKDISCLVFNDGSNDNTDEVLKSLEEMFPSLRHISQPENRGRGAARNTLLNSATADYVAWQDADDSWEPNKIERQMSHLAALEAEKPDCPVILTCPHYRVTGRSLDVNEIIPLQEYTVLSLLGAGSDPVPPIQLQTCLARRDAWLMVDGFSDALNWSEDFEFFLRFLDAGGAVRSMDSPTPLAWYFFTLAGKSAKEIEAAHAYILKTHETLWRGAGIDPKIEFVLRQLRYSWHAYLSNDQPIEAIEYLLTVLVEHGENAAIRKRLSEALARVFRYYSSAKQIGRGKPTAELNHSELAQRLERSNEGKKVAIYLNRSGEHIVKYSADAFATRRWNCLPRNDGDPIASILITDGDGGTIVHLKPQQIQLEGGEIDQAYMVPEAILYQFLRARSRRLSLIVRTKKLELTRNFTICRLSNGRLGLWPHTKL